MSDLDDMNFGQIVEELDNGQSLLSENEAHQGVILDPIVNRGYQDPLHAEFERLDRAAQVAGVRDEFYQQVEAQVDRKNSINKEAISVGNPLSATGQNLGGIAQLTSDLIIVSKSVARFQGLDAETGPVTITAGLVTPLAPGGASIVRPFIYLRWGAYGFNWVAEIDIGMGRQLTVNAAMVEVDVALDALTTANAAQANMAANLSFKPMVRTSPLIRSRYIDGLAQDATSTVVVPPFAVAVLPVQMSDAAGTVLLEFYDSSNTIRYVRSLVNGVQNAPIPLSGDINKIVATNKIAATQHIRIPFELAI